MEEISRDSGPKILRLLGCGGGGGGGRGVFFKRRKISHIHRADLRKTIGISILIFHTNNI